MYHLGHGQNGGRVNSEEGDEREIKKQKNGFKDKLVSLLSHPHNMTQQEDS